MGFLGNVRGSARASRLLWRVAANLGPGETERSLPDQGGLGGADPDDYRFGVRAENAAYSATVDWVASSRWLLSARAGSFRFDSHTTSGQRAPYETEFSGSPASFPETPVHLVRPSGFSLRTSAAADALGFFQVAGEHQVKAGVQLERLEHHVLRTDNASRHHFGWDQRDPFFGERGTYGYFWLENPASAGAVRSENLALLLQDTWSVHPDLTLNLGLRAEQETVPDYRLGREGDAAIEFDFDDKLAPRLGFAWDVGGDRRWKVYGSWGRYFDVTKYQLARTLFGAERRVLYTYALDDLDWTRVACEVSDNDPARAPDCGLPLIGALNLRSSANDSVDPAIRPMQSREWQLGVEHPLGSFLLGARFLRKQLVRTIEDIGFFDPILAAEVYSIGNPGEGASREARPGLAMPRPVRDYRAFELTATRRLAGRWMLDASYTYSRPGSTSSTPTAARSTAAWAPTVRTSSKRAASTAGRTAPASASASTPAAAPRAPPSPRGRASSSSPYGRGDLGRNPTLTQTDLRLAYERDVGRATVELSVVVLNLFDEDTVLDVGENAHRGDLLLSDEELRNGFDLDALIAEQGQERDPAYGKAGRFQSPRRVRWGVAVRF